ncbi:MAG: fructokinase [Anaerolineaceae bacterium]|nr:fructokinase [Anaerolineaceae bacterium]
MDRIFGGIEAGGTKFVCVIASGPNKIYAEERFPTTTPQETIQKAVAFFNAYQKNNNIKLSALGVGSFGPLDPNPTSKTFGFITSTPKPGWKNSDLLGPLKSNLNIPIAFDTDVNAAAIGEGLWGAAKGLDNFMYFTIGTGVGGGAIINGKPLHGLLHPEMGHIRLKHDLNFDPFEGNCPYHGDCFEGLVAGPALQKRFGQPAYNLPIDHPGWDLVAHYIALAMSDFICSFSPQRIILGGGVMQQTQLFPLIHEKTIQYLNGYVQSPVILENIHKYIVPPKLGNQAGMLGSIAMAMQLF